MGTVNQVAPAVPARGTATSSQATRAALRQSSAWVSQVGAGRNERGDVQACQEKDEGGAEPEPDPAETDLAARP